MKKTIVISLLVVAVFVTGTFLMARAGQSEEQQFVKELTGGVWTGDWKSSSASSDGPTAKVSIIGGADEGMKLNYEITRMGWGIAAKPGGTDYIAKVSCSSSSQCSFVIQVKRGPMTFTRLEDGRLKAEMEGGSYGYFKKVK